MSDIIITCAHCGERKAKASGAVNRAKREGRPMFCNRKCFGLSRRQEPRSDVEKKRLKAEYDRDYRARNAALLKIKKAKYFHETYNPEIARIDRKRRSKQHAEYCRRPEYKEWKRGYDRKYRAKKLYGPFAQAALLLADLDREILSRSSRYEVSYGNGTLNKSQNRKRSYV